MKNVLTKMGYMAIGCLLTLIGYHFGNVENNSVSAQQPSEGAANIVDKIRVRQLDIVDDNNTTRVELRQEGIRVYNAMGGLRTAILTDQDRGAVVVFGKGPPTGAAVLLDVDNNGGRISLWNKLIDKPVFQAAVADKGEGLIVLKDSTGEDTNFLGFRDFHTYSIPGINFERRERKRVAAIATGTFTVTDTSSPDPIPKGKKLDRILRVGDSLVFKGGDIAINEAVDMNVRVIKAIREETVKFQNPKGNRSVIILRNGTVYIAPNGCEIINGVITKGEIEVYTPNH